ncbi:hypothetical protein PoB_004356300 [Plakobranchus ocellatus]|uniref:Uncharacterized protein n=1 Tax=Plakobranchus ocellatus TaxID=259542 RepID=A0AAV4BD03_9GAST|nr:hypothetical protein PoB_004356300 [Plakobranchus ocellatus]
MLSSSQKELPPPPRVPPLIYDEQRLQEELKLKMAAAAVSSEPVSRPSPSPFHPSAAAAARVLDSLALTPHLHPLTYLYGGLGGLQAALTAEHLKSCQSSLSSMLAPAASTVSGSAFSIDSILSRPGPIASFPAPPSQLQLQQHHQQQLQHAQQQQHQTRPPPYFPYPGLHPPHPDLLGKSQ